MADDPRETHAVSVAVTNEARFARCSVYVPPEGCPDRPRCPVHGKAPCAGYYAEAPEGDRYCAQAAEHWVMSPTHANRAGFIWSDREAEESYARVLAGEPAAPRVVDVDSLAIEIPEAAMLAVIEVMGWPDDRNDPGGDGAPPAACWTLATDIVRAAHVPLLAEIAFITASSQSMQREFVDVMAERDTARAEAQGLRIDNGHYEDLTVEQDSAARSKIRALTADLAAARADAANLRDLIRDIRIACLGAQFPSDGDHEKAWEAFDKAGIDA